MPPTLSIVIPAYNEEARLGRTLDAWLAYLAQRDFSWEILVVDDGSRDQTAAIVQAYGTREQAVHIVTRPHLGKGAAVRFGMLAVTGGLRFMADADLSMRPEELERFFTDRGEPRFDVTIGSRETSGARRVAEPIYRHIIGRIYNHLARLLLIENIDDTQCGYKLLTSDAAVCLFERQSLDGFGFDVEIIYLAQRLGLTVGEVPLTWHYDPDSRVSLGRGFGGFVDIARVCIRAWLGRYGDLQASHSDARLMPRLRG